MPGTSHGVYTDLDNCSALGLTKVVLLIGRYEEDLCGVDNRGLRWDVLGS